MAALPEVSLVCSDFWSKDREGRVEQSHIKTYFSIFHDYNLSYGDLFRQVRKDGINGLHEGESVYWGNIYETMLFGNIILTSTTLSRREVLDQIGLFDTTYSTLEDYDLYLKLTKRFVVAFVDKSLICYRYSQDQLTGATHFEQLCINLRDIFEKNIAGIEDETFFKKYSGRIKRHRGMILGDQAYFYFSQNKPALAARFYWKSLRVDPFRYKRYLYLFAALLPSGLTGFIKKLKTLSRRGHHREWRVG